MACRDADRPRGIKNDCGESSKKQQPRSSYNRDCEPNNSEQEDHLLPELKPVEGTELQFTKFPEKHYPDNATPSEITSHSLDYSYLLQCLLNCHEK